MTSTEVSFLLKLYVHLGLNLTPFLRSGTQDEGMTPIWDISNLMAEEEGNSDRRTG